MNSGLATFSDSFDACFSLDHLRPAPYNLSHSPYSHSMTDLRSRRQFLLQAGTGATAALIAAHWPAMLSAAERAGAAAQSAAPYKFEFFTPDEAREIDAISARIIPTDETPGAHEAGVVYFIDRALMTFASDDQATYREGLPDLQSRVRKAVAGVDKFSSATPQQQDAVLHELELQQGKGRQLFAQQGARPPFFDALRTHTVIGFLILPEAGGNNSGVGWKLIGRERDHMFQPPFGYYDKNYPGWQASGENKTDKTKT
jgi:Gluconate 2-dehydrogenase subunit 3